MPRARFIQYMRPLIEALKELGNSGTPAEVRDIIAQDLDIPDEVLDEQLASGDSRFRNDVHWARYYLLKAGHLESSQRGVWTLTEKGIKSNLTPEETQAINQKVQKEWGRSQTSEPEEPSEDDDPAPADFDPSLTGDHRTDLLALMRQMNPGAFERLCRRFLREAGFQQVEVTGKSGDGGIDGKGILEINPLMSIQVLFQCKRYKGSVGSQDIRNFRGAMTGRTDKGIFITTGTFTVDARREALREGAPPIELVDAEKLVSMFEELELGLKPKKAYEIDTDFWQEFVGGAC